MRAPSLAVIQVVVAMLAFACAGADEIRLPADAAGLSAGASSLHAAIEQFMAAVEDEHAAMAATTAAYADHQRHLLQAIAGGGGTTANLASNLPTTMAAMGSTLSGLASSAATAVGASSAAASSAGGVAAAAAAAAAAPSAILTAISDLEAEFAQFCSPAAYSPPTQTPAQFAGPGFTLALIPHSCLIFPANKTLACAPANIVLLKTPGSWNKAFDGPAGYSGKSCQIVQPLGTPSTTVLGADPYTVPIPAVTAPSLSLNDFTGLFSGLAPSAAPVSSGSSAAAASGPSAAAAGG